MQLYFRILWQESLTKNNSLGIQDAFDRSLMWIPVYLLEVNSGFVLQSVTAWKY